MKASLSAVPDLGQLERRASTKPRSPAASLDVVLDELSERVASEIDRRLAERLEELTESRSPRLLDRRGLAAALGCGVDTIDRLRREGAPEILVGDVPRFDLADVLAWLKSRAVQS